MKFSTTSEEEVSINLTPLIDVVFLLLIFFMVSTTFQKETKLDLSLPTANSSSKPIEGITNIVLAIDSVGRYNVAIELKGQQSELKVTAPQDLAKQLQILFDQHPDGTLVIKADGQTPHESVVFCLDAARKIGLKKVRFAAEAGPS